MNGIEWLFFDIGGTLFDETAAWDDRIQRTCKKHGIPETDFRAAMQQAAAQNKHEYRGALEAYGIHFGEKWNAEHIAPYPEARQVLEKLKARYRLGIIANQPLNTRKRMENEWRLADMFELMIISAEVGFSKPDPLLFREALYKAQVSAERCIMTGDKLTNDIVPAKALGFKTIWIKQEWGGLQTITDDSMKPDIEVRCLNELVDVLLKG